MSVRLPGVSNELAAAIRRVNALRASLPEKYRPPVNIDRWRKLQAQLDGACSVGSVESALAALAAWEAAESRPLTDALLNAPLEGAA